MRRRDSQCGLVGARGARCSSAFSLLPFSLNHQSSSGWKGGRGWAPRMRQLGTSASAWRHQASAAATSSAGLLEEASEL